MDQSQGAAEVLGDATEPRSLLAALAAAVVATRAAAESTAEPGWLPHRGWPSREAARACDRAVTAAGMLAVPGPGLDVAGGRVGRASWPRRTAMSARGSADRLAAVGRPN